MFDYGQLLLNVAGLFTRVFNWEILLAGQSVTLGSCVIFTFMVGMCVVLIRELIA